MFKHILLSTLLLLGFGRPAQAQPTAHQWLLTGGINLRSNTTSNDNSQNSNAGVSISPAVGYFLTDHFAVGLGGGLGFGHSENTFLDIYGNNPGKNTRTYSSYTLNVFGRYYARLTDHTAFTATLAPGFGRSRDKSEMEGSAYPYNNFEIKRSSLGVSLTPGFSWFPTSRVSLDVTAGNLGYFRSKDTNQNQPETTNSSWNASLSLLSLGVGASLFFGGGQ